MIKLLLLSLAYTSVFSRDMPFPAAKISQRLDIKNEKEYRMEDKYISLFLSVIESSSNPNRILELKDKLTGKNEENTLYARLSNLSDQQAVKEIVYLCDTKDGVAGHYSESNRYTASYSLTPFNMEMVKELYPNYKSYYKIFTGKYQGIYYLFGRKETPQICLSKKRHSPFYMFKTLAHELTHYIEHDENQLFDQRILNISNLEDWHKYYFMKKSGESHSTLVGNILGHDMEEMFRLDKTVSRGVNRKNIDFHAGEYIDEDLSLTETMRIKIWMFISESHYQSNKTMKESVHLAISKYLSNKLEFLKSSTKYHETIAYSLKTELETLEENHLDCLTSWYKRACLWTYDYSNKIKDKKLKQLTNKMELKKSRLDEERIENLMHKIQSQ